MNVQITRIVRSFIVWFCISSSITMALYGGWTMALLITGGALVGVGGAASFDQLTQFSPIGWVRRLRRKVVAAVQAALRTK